MMAVKFKIANYKLLLAVLILVSSIGTAQSKRAYLFHTEQNITRLKKIIETQPEIRASWSEQLKTANEIIKRGIGRHEDLQILALVYRMTEEARYAQEIATGLKKYTSREYWEGGDLLNRNPPWKAGLHVAHTSFSVALGYDAAYNYLSENDRKEIAKGLVRLGIQPILDDWLSPTKSIHTLDTMGHNWWSSVVFTGGLAALAIRNEVPEALDWVKQISEAGTEWTTYSGSLLQNKIPSFDHDGGFWESINYAAFGVGEYLKFRLALQNALPDFQQPALNVLSKVADFFIYTTYYRKDEKPLMVNFGDGSLTRTGNACMVLLYNLGYQNKRNAWYLGYTHSGNDSEALQTGTPNGLILYPDLPEIEPDFVPELPLAHRFQDMNWATMRSSWEDNASMLAVKSGFTWNHAHADAGSFILFHNGENLVIDSGNSSYSHPLYSDYYVQSEAHNVILFNGEGQDRKDAYFGTVNHGSLNHLIDGVQTKYILADASGPYAKNLRRNYRSFLWLDDIILVIDDLLAHEPGKFEWLLHYNGESQRRGKDLYIKKAAAQIKVRPLFPAAFPDGGLPHDFPEMMQLHQKQGYEDHHPDQLKPYWSFSHFEKTQRTKFINALILQEEKKTEPIIEQFEGSDYLGLRIIRDEVITEVYFNLLADGRIKHRNSIITMNGWETDAYLTAITYPKSSSPDNLSAIQNVFMAHGSYLRRNNKVLIHALSKFYAEINYTDQINLEFDGQQGARIFLRAESNQKEIVLNGKSVETLFNKDLNGLQFNNTVE